MRVRAGLAIWIDAAAFVSDEGVYRGGFMVDELADEDGGTGVVGDNYELASVIESDLARIITHSLNP
jgi:hypothetical protein